MSGDTRHRLHSVFTLLNRPPELPALFPLSEQILFKHQTHILSFHLLQVTTDDSKHHPRTADCETLYNPLPDIRLSADLEEGKHFHLGS